jgi:hypothetical protein
MATLQIYNEGSWETYSSQNPLGKVVYYRWQGETSTSLVASDPFPTAGASHVVAYLGTVNSGTVTGTTLNIAVEAFPGASPTQPNASLAAANGGTVIQGAPHGTTAASNTAAYSEALAAQSSLAIVQAGSTPDADYVIEVHFG